MSIHRSDCADCGATDMELYFSRGTLLCGPCRRAAYRLLPPVGKPKPKAPEPRVPRKGDPRTPGRGTSIQRHPDGTYRTADGRFEVRPVEARGGARAWEVVDTEAAGPHPQVLEKTLTDARWAIRDLLAWEEEA